MERAFENKVAVVADGARGIGKCIREGFEKQGANVCVIDLLDNHFSHPKLQNFCGRPHRFAMEATWLIKETNRGGTLRAEA